MVETLIELILPLESLIDGYRISPARECLSPPHVQLVDFLHEILLLVISNLRHLFTFDQDKNLTFLSLIGLGWVVRELLVGWLWHVCLLVVSGFETAHVAIEILPRVQVRYLADKILLGQREEVICKCVW